MSDAEGQAAATASLDASALRHVEKLLREDTKAEFVIDRMIGKGGMALVYLGHETRLGRKVAIKVLPPELTFGHGVERFTREARTAAALDHPHIIPIHRVSTGESIFWYAMKYLEGQSLEDLLKAEERLSLDETIQILAQVADALDYAHERKVIHRDIKPGNVMLDARRRVVVTDFGIAKALTEGTLTASGSAVGTPLYMSPEQGMGKGITGASDQYSTAIMAYRMLSGQLPFSGTSGLEILHKHLMDPPPPLDVIQAGLPWYVYRAVHRALEKGPEKRFESVSAFVAALRAPSPDMLISGESEARAATPPPKSSRTIPPVAKPVSAPRPFSRVSTKEALETTGRRPPKPGRLIMTIGAAVLVVVGGVSGWVALGGGSDAGKVAPVPTPTPPAPQPAPAPGPGKVEITRLPLGASAFADGRRQPGTSFDLAPGRHEIRMEAGGYETVRESVTVTEGSVTRVVFAGRLRSQGRVNPPPRTRVDPPVTAAPLEGLIIVRVTPVANVWIDGEDRGVRAQLADTLISGAHTIRITKAGFVPVDTTVTVIAGDTIRPRFDLKRLSPP